MRRESEKITLPKEDEKLAIERIIEYFEKDRGETLGNMEALMVYTFFIEKIAPFVYNLAVMNSQKFINDKADEMYGLLL